MKEAADTTITVEATVWMEVDNPDLTMEEAAESLREMGNEVLEVDEENRRVKVLDQKQEGPVEDILPEGSYIYECETCCAFRHHKRNIVESHEFLCEHGLLESE